MFLLIDRHRSITGIFSTKEKMKAVIEYLIHEDYEKTGSYGWFHFRYLEFEPDTMWFSDGNPNLKEFYSFSTMHPEFFTEIENNPKTGELINF